MTNPQLILAILTGVINAIDGFAALAKIHDAGEGAIAALKRIEAKANEEAGRLIPAEALALGLFGVVNAAAVGKAIASMPADPVCPECGAVVRRWISLNPTTHEKTERQACDVVTCGWRS
jgi:hypothetical protein